MRILLYLAIFLGFRVAVLAQCTPPALTIDNLPQAVCIDAAPVPLVGYPSGGFFLANGAAVNFFDPAALGVGNHAVTYFLIYNPACPPVNLTQIVSVKPSLQIQAINDTITCLNPLANLGISSSGPVSGYQWFGPNGFFSQDPAPGVDVPGDYFVIAENGGCSAAADIVIRENLVPPSNPSASGGTIDCISNTLQLSASCDLVQAQYEWLGPAGFSSSLPNPLVEVAGQYLVQITDPQNGCFISVPVAVFAPPLPDLNATVSGIITCRDTQAVLSATSSNLNVSFTWQRPDGMVTPAQNITVNQPGQYTIQVEDTAGCKSTAIVEVLENKAAPSVNLNANAQALTCTVKEILLTVATNLPADMAAYIWSDPFQQTISSADKVNIATPGTYTAVITDKGNGCTAAETVTVGIDTLPPVAIANISRPLCSDAQGELSGTGSLTNGATQYRWISVEGNWLEMPNGAVTAIESAGTYILEITDPANGCQATDILVVDPPLYFPDGLDIEISQPTCIGNNGVVSVQNNGAGIFSYNFKNAGFGNQSLFEKLVPGSYLLQISELDGCVYDTVVTLLVPPPFGFDLIANSSSINQGEQVTIQAVFNVPATEIQDIVWSRFSEEICKGCIEIMDTPLAPAIYRVSATTVDGCKASQQISISVIRNLDFYLGNVFSPNADGMNDLLVPQFGKSVKSVSGFRIYDRWGALVYENNALLPDANNEGWDGKIRGNMAPPGVYIYQIELTYIDGRHEMATGDVLLAR